MNTFKRKTSWFVIFSILMSACLPGASGKDNWLCIGLDGHVNLNDAMESCHSREEDENTGSSTGCRCGHEESTGVLLAVDTEDAGHGHHGACIDLPLVSGKYIWLATTQPSPDFTVVSTAGIAGEEYLNTSIYIEVPVMTIDPGGYLATVMFLL